MGKAKKDKGRVTFRLEKELIEDLEIIAELDDDRSLNNLAAKILGKYRDRMKNDPKFSSALNKPINSK